MSQRQVRYLPAQVVKASAAPLPEGKSIARGWSAVPLGEDRDEMALAWQLDAAAFQLAAGQNSRLRLTVALDYRDAQLVEVFTRHSNEPIGTIDIRYAYVFQPFELLLSSEQTAAALEQGIRLVRKGGIQPLWVFDALDGTEERVMFAPHLMIGEPDCRIEEALHTMLSLSSLQPFGWMEGCREES
ncbi:hypothetical protein CF651_20660, partial [Paenibacillus rigui]